MTPHPPQPAHITQEQMILVQAKQNVLTLEPRLKVAQESLETIEDAVSTAPHLLAEGKGVEAVLGIIEAIAKVQLIQLRQSITEGQNSLDKSKEVIQQIENPGRILRPTPFIPKLVG